MGKYVVYIVTDEREKSVGEYNMLSDALVKARCACREAGNDWDWIVDSYKNECIISRRSSIAGLEYITYT